MQNITSISKPVKVEFIKSLFEDDFVESGMIAKLYHVEYSERFECWKLWFDFTGFEEHNDTLMEDVYSYPSHAYTGPTKSAYNGHEAGMYDEYLMRYFGKDFGISVEEFEADIKNYLKVIE